MKAVVFTTDAIFSLIIAAVGVTVLLYFVYTPSTPLLISYSDTQSILNVLLSLRVSQIANGSAAAREITNQNLGSGSAWSQYRGNATRSESSPYGPLAPSIAFKTGAFGQPPGAPVAAYGNLYFSVGNYIWAVNASSGSFLWNVSVISPPNSIAVYNNMIAYWNATPTVYLSAIYADTGKRAWSYQRSYPPSSQILIYNGYAIYGTTYNTLAVYYMGNGIIENGGVPANSLSFVPLSIAAVNGSIAVRSSSNGLGLLNSTTGGLIWYSVPSNPVTTNVSTLNNLIAYGSNANACATYINGTLAFCTPAGNTIIGVAASNGKLIYQTSASVIALSTSGSIVWNTPLSYGAGHGYPVASGSLAYSTWGSGNLIAQNASTGATVWSTYVPYGPPANMILAYGRLYAASGNSIIAYGACSGSSQSSIMSVASNLYANGDGSCADALLNSAYPLVNYSVSLNGSLEPYQRLAYFVGTGSSGSGSGNYISVGTRGLPPGANARSVFAWVYTGGNALSGYDVFSYGSDSNGEASGLRINTGGFLGFYSIANDFQSTLQVTDKAWHLVGYAYSPSASSVTLYLDSQSQSGSLSSNVPLNTIVSGASIGSAFWNAYSFNGSIANVQVYNKTLNSSQAALLYKGGVQGGPLKNYGIVSWWPLDGDANDYGGFNNTGYPVNVTYRYAGYAPASLKNAFQVSKAGAVLPVSSYAANFNGTTDYIGTGTSRLPTGSSARSVFAWVYPANIPVGVAPVVFGYGTRASGEDALLQIQNNGKLGFGGFSDNFQTGVTLSPSLNEWHLVGYTYAAGSTQVTLYLDGNSQTGSLSGGIPLNTILPGADAADIGKAPNGETDGYFTGSIADVQVYNTSLAPSQALLLYREGMDGTPIGGAGLVSWWPLNGNANDYGGPNNGQPYNGINYTLVSDLYNTGILTWK